MFKKILSIFFRNKVDHGWVVPPTAHIPVLLAGLKEPEWALEEDELKY